MGMNLKAVTYFLTASSEGSFTEAAKICGVSQPSLSKAVRRLERELGVNLFERDSPAQLTHDGRKLRPLFEQLRLCADRLLQTASQMRSMSA
jgi:LysR family hydrogen peroxide-inducible transcriptional activator